MRYRSTVIEPPGIVVDITGLESLGADLFIAAAVVVKKVLSYERLCVRTDVYSITAVHTSAEMSRFYSNGKHYPRMDDVRVQMRRFRSCLLPGCNRDRIVFTVGRLKKNEDRKD